jgi:alcohol dehydrogenase (cytochrome c)
MVSGVIVVEGKVISGRSCSPSRDNCYIAAHDAKTGAELWRFYTAAGSNEPGGDTWAGAPDATRAASTWGLPGGYDPVKRLVYWGVANPTPNTRANRHGGKYDAIGYTAPIDLYSNSTIALNPTPQAGLVLPAPAGRRLGRGLPARADAAAHAGEPRPEVREVDQPGREEGRAA